jgi:adenylate kinase
MSRHVDRAAWLKSGGATCRNFDPYPPRAFRMILLGAPGIGKGTQAELLCDRLQTCHLSTGDIFRAAKNCGDACTPAMKSALVYMQRGDLVPDEIVIDLVRERINCLKCECGFLLDGFPRTVCQAEALDGIFQAAGLVLDAVLDYELPEDEVVARLSGRRTCKQCKTTYHIKSKPSQVEGVCDKCGGELYRRDDDCPDAIRVRLEAYHTSTEPLRDYYRERGLLIEIPASGSPQDVLERTILALSDHDVL